MVLLSLALMVPIGSVFADYVFTISPNGTVPDNISLSIYVKADFQSHTWLQIFGTSRQQLHFNDFGGPEHTSIVLTSEWGLGTLTICSVAQRDGQTEEEAIAQRHCQDLTVVASGAPPGQSIQSAGADFYGFCRSQGYDRTGGNPQNAYTATCDGGPNGSVGIDMYALCAWQSNGTLPYPGLQDTHRLNTWTCNAVPTNISPPFSDNSGGGNNGGNNGGGNNAPAPAQPQAPAPAQNNGGGNNNPPPANNSGGSCSGGIVAVGDSAQITPGPSNNLRSQPSRSASIISVMPGGSPITIVGGPQCADGLRWWQVNYRGNVGWTGEGNGSTNWIQKVSGGQSQPAPAQPQAPNPVNPSTNGASAVCNSPAPVAVGSLGRVTPGPANNLRADTSSSSALLAEMPGGAEFMVIGGPVCVGQYRWWQVNYNGNIGWTADGNGSVNWIEYVGGGSPPSGSASVPNLTVISAAAVRLSPNIFAGKLGTASQGQVYEVVGKNGSSEWLQINTNAGVGWICRSLTTTSSDIFLVPVRDSSRENCEIPDSLLLPLKSIVNSDDLYNLAVLFSYASNVRDCASYTGLLLTGNSVQLQALMDSCEQSGNQILDLLTAYIYPPPVY